MSPEVRSKIMAKIKGRDTSPERNFRSLLHAQGFRFRVCAEDLPGKPDLKLTKYQAVIFINGCFWHGHTCHYFRMPKNNEEYWKKKIETNRNRDHKVITELIDSGWRVCIIWECALRNKAIQSDPDIMMGKVNEWLQSSKQYLELNDLTATAKANFSTEDSKGLIALTKLSENHKKIEK